MVAPYDAVLSRASIQNWNGRNGKSTPYISRWLPALLFTVLLSHAFARQAPAQTGAAYKVGEKIECDITGKWQPGTIVQVAPNSTGIFYLVNNDNEAHTWDRWASAAQIRARTGVISETVKAHNALMALGMLNAPKPGSLDETFQSLIRDRYASQGSKEFPVTVTFQGFLIGQTHAYGGPDARGESADGPGGSAGTKVCSVSAQYYYRVAYRDAYLTNQQDDLYLCFKNAFDKWQCNLGSGNGAVKRYREERAE